VAIAVDDRVLEILADFCRRLVRAHLRPPGLDNRKTAMQKRMLQSKPSQTVAGRWHLTTRRCAGAFSPLVSEIFKSEERRYAAVQLEDSEVAGRPICPNAQHCANSDVRIKLLENEVARLQGLDAIREDVANLLKEEIAELTRKLRTLEDAPKANQFRRAKIVISKALHPNNFVGDDAQQRLRGEIFREIWPQIERIERGQDESGAVR
jgi:hypothetical protein